MYESAICLSASICRRMRFKGLLHESNTKYNAVMKISIT